MNLTLSSLQQERLTYWLPALTAGAVTLAAFVWMGQTPLLRAAALALAIVGVSLTLRRLGAIISMAGGLIFAFTPAYWSQAGGPPTVNPSLMILFLAVALVVAAALWRWNQNLFVAAAVGMVLFVGLYLLFGLTQRSLRLTTILSAWLLYSVVIALRQTNPRPDELPAVTLGSRHTVGILLMLMLGVLNDPLMTWFAPAVVLGLWLSRARLAWWYWAGVALVVAYGVFGVVQQYGSASWLWASAESLHRAGLFAPFLVLDGWREPIRWLYLTELIIRQFTWVGVLFSVIGAARLSRWYPTLGVTLLIAYASYGFFGLIYFGKDAEILLLPLLMIQTVWMTYSAYTVIQWLQGLLRIPRRAYGT